MATITKTKAGTFKAIIRKNNRIIKTKTFRLKKDARTWSKRIEGDRDAMMTFGSPGASIQFNQLADEYLGQWTGRKRSPATVNRKRACLSSLFKFAVKEKGYVTDNPVRLVSFSHREQ